MRRLAPLTLAAFLCGCSTTTTETRKQPVKVITDPAGAEVWTVGARGRDVSGPSPATLEAAYEVRVTRPNGACWIGPALGAAFTGGAIYSFTQLDLDSSGWEGPGYLLGGIFGSGIGLGLLVTAFVCTGDGYDEPGGIPRTLTVGASAPGREDRSAQLLIPGPVADLQLVLPKETGGGAVLGALSGVGGLGLLEQPADEFLDGAPQPGAYALAIGIQRYRDVAASDGARRDAERFATLARTTLGVPERNVRLALDDRATRSDLEKELAWLAANVPAGGRIYLFFAGHGAPDPVAGTPYLVPYDGDPAYLDRTALPLETVTAALAKTKARDVVVFVDACFSGTGGRSVLPAGTRPLVPVKEAKLPGNVAVLSAAGAREISGIAADRSGGLFTSHLLEAVGQGRADQDGDGQLNLEEIAAWVAPRVERDAKRDNREQHPAVRVGAGQTVRSLVVAYDVRAR